MNLSDQLELLIDAKGLKTVADLIGCDKAKLSRFRSGSEGLMMDQLQRLIEISDLVFIHSRKYKRLKLAIVTMSELYKEEAGL